MKTSIHYSEEICKRLEAKKLTETISPYAMESVILQEIGVDKYSDVLDSEVAELDFTETYMRSISQPAKLKEAMAPVETEVRQQMANARKYKDVIKEDKDLSELVGRESDFDVEEALQQLLIYYDNWQGNELTLMTNIGINDDRITKHLKLDIVQDRFSPLLSLSIKNFPNEAGYFMLWELSLTDVDSDRRIIPIFVNEAFVLRPVAGKRISDVLLDAEYAKEEFREKWDKKYPNIIKSWDKNWAELTTFFEYPQEIRKIIYTTNAVEGYHRMVRKFTKSKSIFPTDDSIRKVIYMSVKEISKKWTMPVRDWGLAYSQ